jgi:hypothetical protein
VADLVNLLAMGKSQTKGFRWDPGKGTVIINSVCFPIRCEFGPSQCYSTQFVFGAQEGGLHGGVREGRSRTAFFSRSASTSGEAEQR